MQKNKKCTKKIHNAITLLEFIIFNIPNIKGTHLFHNTFYNSKRTPKDNVKPHKIPHHPLIVRPLHPLLQIRELI